MHRNKIYLVLVTFITMQHSFAQNTAGVEELPVTILPAANDTGKPMVLYLTGDGGWNKFSKALSQVLASRGYPVIALNSRDYFWKKKTAEQTGLDAGRLIRTYQQRWNRKKVILIGYSFGADVLPFAFNRLPADLSAQVLNINLLSPSVYTDFEIHISVMLGGGVSHGESVVSEINKITSKPVTFIFGKGEKDFPLTQVRIKNYVSLVLDGGHHYDGDEDKVCNTIISHLPSK